MDQLEWERLTPDEKKYQLYLEQKETLECLVERKQFQKKNMKKSYKF